MTKVTLFDIELERAIANGNGYLENLAIEPKAEWFELAKQQYIGRMAELIAMRRPEFVAWLEKQAGA